MRAFGASTLQCGCKSGVLAPAGVRPRSRGPPVFGGPTGLARSMWLADARMRKDAGVSNTASFLEEPRVPSDFYTVVVLTFWKILLQNFRSQRQWCIKILLPWA